MTRLTQKPRETRGSSRDSISCAILCSICFEVLILKPVKETDIKIILEICLQPVETMGFHFDLTYHKIHETVTLSLDCLKTQIMQFTRQVYTPPNTPSEQHYICILYNDLLKHMAVYVLVQ